MYINRTYSPGGQTYRLSIRIDSYRFARYTIGPEGNEAMFEGKVQLLDRSVSGTSMSLNSPKSYLFLFFSFFSYHLMVFIWTYFVIILISHGFNCTVMINSFNSYSLILSVYSIAHPENLTWILQIMVCTRYFSSNMAILGIYCCYKLQGCNL